MCLNRTYWEEWEKTNLAPYASKSDDEDFSKRLYEMDDYQDIKDPAGSESRYRTSFQIDKDRILNSTALRRLEYKTQIFVNHEGDNYRTRLTHTTEVSSIAKRIAKAMRLNEDLVEAIALGHDLGHTPFGHAGEEALNEGELLGDYGFYHNLHSLRIVDELEEGFDWDRRNDNFCGKGLNLTFAVREGILKHTDRGFRDDDKKIYKRKDYLRGIEPLDPATLEGQVVALADEIAQRVNDIEDGLRSRLITKDNVIGLIRTSIQNDKDYIENLIRAEKHAKEDQEIVDRRTEKYLHIVKSCQENCKPPTLNNLIGFIRELWTANVIEYSRRNIKLITEHSDELGDEKNGKFHSQLHTFNTEDQDKIEELPGIKPVEKLKQEQLKGRKETEAEFCEISISGKKNPIAGIKIVKRTLERNKVTEKLNKKFDDDILIDSDSRKYFIKWINSDMAVWRTQRVLVLAITTDNKEIFKNYPIEQVKIKINEKNIISFSKEMDNIDKTFKHFIEKYIHRSSKVARMNTKGVEMVKKVFNKLYENPYQLPIYVWKNYSGTINEGNSVKDLDHFMKESIKEKKNDIAFRQLLGEYIAGMTDRFLIDEFERLFLPSKYIEEKEDIHFSK